MIVLIKKYYDFLLLFFKDLFPFFNFWLCWVFVAAHRLSPVAESRGFSCCRTWALGVWASVARAQQAHGLSCSVACGIFPDQGSNPCPLHWQADS